MPPNNGTRPTTLCAAAHAWRWVEFDHPGNQAECYASEEAFPVLSHPFLAGIVLLIS
jgi:hypothetical protein